MGKYGKPVNHPPTKKEWNIPGWSVGTISVENNGKYNFLRLQLDCEGFSIYSKEELEQFIKDLSSAGTEAFEKSDEDKK